MADRVVINIHLEGERSTDLAEEAASACDRMHAVGPANALDEKKKKKKLFVRHVSAIAKHNAATDKYDGERVVVTCGGVEKEMAWPDDFAFACFFYTLEDYVRSNGAWRKPPQAANGIVCIDGDPADWSVATAAPKRKRAPAPIDFSKLIGGAVVNGPPTTGRTCAGC